MTLFFLKFQKDTNNRIFERRSVINLVTNIKSFDSCTPDFQAPFIAVTTGHADESSCTHVCAQHVCCCPSINFLPVYSASTIYVKSSTCRSRLISKRASLHAYCICMRTVLVHHRQPIGCPTEREDILVTRPRNIFRDTRERLRIYLRVGARGESSGRSGQERGFVRFIFYFVLFAGGDRLWKGWSSGS